MVRVVRAATEPARPVAPSQTCPECGQSMTPVIDDVELFAGQWWQCARRHQWLTRHGRIVRRTT